VGKRDFIFLLPLLGERDKDLSLRIGDPRSLISRSPFRILIAVSTLGEGDVSHCILTSPGDNSAERVVCISSSK
jgi:hypothetical protein